MATKLWDPSVGAAQWRQTRVVGQTTFTIALPATAPAGSTLIITSGGGAQTTMRHTDAAGAAFTRDAQGLGSVDSSVHRLVLATPCSTVHVTLNGAENVGGTIYGFAEALTLIGGSSVGSIGPAVSNDFQVTPSAPVTVASGNALLVAAFAVATATPFDGLNQWRGLGPIGRLYSNFGFQPASGTRFIAASGLADVSAAGRYPAHLGAGQYRATSTWIGGGSPAAAQAVYGDSSGVATNPPVNPVVAENSLPGTIRNNWFLGNAGTSTGICGYTGRVSYQPGETVDFKVHSAGQAHRVEIYRLGYYGWETFGARNVLGNQAGYIAGNPAAQPAPTVDPATGAVSCAWTTTATWSIPPGACPGVYLALFRRQDAGNTGLVATTHFTVRPATVAVAGKHVVVTPDLTHQAYNLWGAPNEAGTGSNAYTGRSLYSGAAAATPTFTQRGAAVSFDRPYAIQSTQTNTYLFDAPHSWMMFAEAQGIDLTYVSDLDLDVTPGLLVDAGSVVMLGHHEYITTGVYDAVQAAVDAGRNLLVIGSNIALWRVRFAAGDSGRRTMICYKDSAVPDAGPSVAATPYDPVSWTGTWRDTRTLNGGAKINPDVRRENRLFGQMFRISAPLGAKLTVPDSRKTLPLYRNATAVQALAAGQSWTSAWNVIGDEGEIADGSTGQPANLVALSPTPITSANGANEQGTVYNLPVNLVAGWTLHRASSGALVLATGSWRASWGLTQWAAAAYGSPVSAVDVTLQQVWLNVLHDLGLTHTTGPRAMRPSSDPALTDPAAGAPGPARPAIASAYGLQVPSSSFGLGFFAAT